jgi:phospholipase/carboxylesterase
MTAGPLRCVALLALVACKPPLSATQEPAVPNPPAAASPQVLTIPSRAGAPTLLVVMLHGVGASAESFQPVARALAPLLPRAEWLTPDGFHPYDDGAGGWQWFSRRGISDANRPVRVREGATEVSRWIDGELDRRGLAHDRLVVVGFSQGAMLGAWLAVHRSPAPAAVVMLSGRVADDAAPVAGLVATPVFMGQGDDDPVVLPAELDPGARSLAAWGARVEKHRYPALAHQVDDRELRDVAAFLTAAVGGG